MSFTEADYQAAAAALGVPVAAIKAVAEVESSGTTFWTVDGKQVPPIRLEAHWFGRLTNYVYNDTHPHISSRKWNPALAASTHIGAWDQFNEAASLDFDAAVQATSWGAFQIMGFHASALGYESPQEMKDAADTAGGQLDMFVRFIKDNVAAHDALRRRDWWMFECHYNGGGYGGRYASKMAVAYERNRDGVLRMGDSGPDVADLQRALGLVVDAEFGPRTDAAVRKLQADHGLTIDGIVGPQTRALLERIEA